MTQIMKFNDFRSQFNEVISLDTTALGVRVYSPNFTDLYALYSRARASKTLAVLEFGSGWSTFAFELALRENKAEYDNSDNNEVRHPNLFQLMTIDCDQDFLNLALRRIKPSEISIRSVVTKAHMDVLAGKICSLYDQLPSFTADFIYLDGPDCDSGQISGEVNGFNLNFGSDGRVYGLPMAGDLLRIENFFWPGTEIVTDGRGANAIFLKNNFQRNWTHSYDAEVDQHVLHLDEPAWGRYSKALLRLKRLSLD